MPSDTGPVLVAEGVTKRYRSVVALEDVSVTIDSGEFVGLIGPNGAGKSTLMGCIAGTLALDGGSIHVSQIDVDSDPVEVRRNVAFVSQELELHDYLTGREFLEFVADVRGADPEAESERIDELLAATELHGAENRLVREYSGGMRRKLAVASALVASTELLLLDESFVGLDPESAHRMREELRAFRDAGGAILLSSHSLEMIQAICSRVLILDEGTLRRDLSVEALKRQVEEGEYDGLTDIYLDVTGASRTPA